MSNLEKPTVQRRAETETVYVPSGIGDLGEKVIQLRIRRAQKAIELEKAAAAMQARRDELDLLVTELDIAEKDLRDACDNLAKETAK